MDYVPICSKEAVQVGCKSVEDIHYFCMMADTQMDMTVKIRERYIREFSGEC